MNRTVAMLACLLVSLPSLALAAGAPKNLGPRPDPFLHVYRESLDGGSQEVLADSAVSRQRIAALRATLRRQAGQYARGRYPDPDGKTAAVSKLRAEARRIAVIYADVPRGGRIVFRTKDSELVSALHDWMASTVRTEQRLHPGGGPGQDTE